MPYNLLLLPLLGGFIFLMKCNYFKYTVARYEANRLILPASVAGLVLIVVARASVILLKLAIPTLAVLCRNVFDFPYIGTALISFLFGVVAWWPINARYSTIQGLRRAILSHDDPFELLLLRAEEQKEMIMIRTRSNEVFLGIVQQVPTPLTARHIELIILKSGYLPTAAPSVEWNVSYLDEYLRRATEIVEFESANPGDSESLANKMDVVKVIIPLAEIVSSKRYIAEYESVGDFVRLSAE